MKPLKVYEVNSYIKKIFNGDMILSNIDVEGEISNFKHHYSGHMYFSLKDEKSRIRCIMFKSDNENMDIILEEGMKVVAKGYISVYDSSGDYQLYIKKIEQKGLGDLYKAYEVLKKKLDEEGLFDSIFKKEIPSMPKKIGVVTSSTGAAVRDIISIIQRRYPPTDILIYPALVQGINAVEDICSGLMYLDEREDIDLIIVGRGGGSIDELFVFNDETLARTIFNLKTPVISAIGHETDFTIADFVSDLRAPTPSAAAELAVPDIRYLIENLAYNMSKLERHIFNFLDIQARNLEIAKKSLRYYDPLTDVRKRNQDLDMVFKDIVHLLNNRLNMENKKIATLDRKLSVLNPYLPLKNGFGILSDEDDNIIRSIHDIKGDTLKIKLHDGDLKVHILEMEQGGESVGN